MLPSQEDEPTALPNLGLAFIYAYTLSCRTTKFSVGGRGVFQVVSHSDAYYTNASRGLSAIAEFLV